MLSIVLALQASRAGADFELLTIVESHILRASEIQRWYKNPGFSRFSSYRQSLKMTSYCQPDLANGKIASKVKVK